MVVYVAVVVVLVVVVVVVVTLSRGPIITVSFIKTKLHFPDIMQVICTVMVPPELIGNIVGGKK